MLSTNPAPTRPADATEEGRPAVRRPVLNRRLAVLAAAAATVAAAPSFFAPDLLHGVPVMDGNLRGTALVTLMTVPLLLLASWRGSVDPRATAVWVGALAYLLYQGVMFSFATPMNSLFLAYVALLAAAGWALAVLVLHVDHQVAARRLGPAFSARPLAVVLAVTAGLNALAWLVLSAPVTWTGRVPSVVVDSGLPTAVTWVQDLSFWLPAAMVVAFLTWRGRPTGPLLAAFFVYYTLEALGVASDQWWGTRADDQHPELASYPAAAGALVVAVLMGGITCWALWRRAPARRRGPGARRRGCVGRSLPRVVSPAWPLSSGPASWSPGPIRLRSPISSHWGSTPGSFPASGCCCRSPSRAGSPPSWRGEPARPREPGASQPGCCSSSSSPCRSHSSGGTPCSRPWRRWRCSWSCSGSACTVRVGVAASVPPPAPRRCRAGRAAPVGCGPPT